ncbi:MAG: quinone oxidoreductase [Bradyrhizobium sp.]|uniref:quinone oxidoreductase family protein n=1 Tax=Bradyrhizobium sp. TaxID=376 RepID=UPI0011FF8E44|nr:quinone oxidoreductase [Bradyrhizobium sp.]THD70398.1 MAG: quinone oxidoreductase [Bradyrhizobium sp.]
MKAISIEAFGGPEVCRLTDAAEPRPAAGEVTVRLAYAGINFIDIYMRNGTYARSDTYQTPLPMTIGMEGAGTVTALGEGVSEPAIGDRVGFCLVRGSYAEAINVPAWKAVPIPDAVPLSVAAAVMLQGSTAHYLSHSAFPLGPGHTCLIHAGAGGVGQLLIQLAKARGARVLTTVGNEDKASIAKRCGADETILYRQADFREEVLRHTDGRGVDVVYDSVGRDTIHHSIRSLKKRGMCILFGASSGVVPSIEPIELAEAGSVFFTRPHLADYMRDVEEIRSRSNDLFRLIASGGLHVAIDREFQLADACEAHVYLEAGRSRGKLLLRTEGRSG